MPMIWYDNLGATYLYAKPIFYACTKHIEVDYYFVHDRVATKAIQIRFIPFKDQLVNVLTKPLPVSLFYCSSVQTSNRISTLGLRRPIIIYKIV